MEKAPRVVGGSPVLMRVALSSVEVMCLGLQKCQQPKIRCSLRGSKDRRLSDGGEVLHRRMSRISVRYILSMPDGETESTFSGVAEGAGLGCL